MITITETTMLQNPNEQAAAAAAQARGAAEGAREQAQAAREQAQAARDQAEASRDQARAAQDQAEAARSEGGGGNAVVTITKDGRTITLDGASPEAISAALGTEIPSRESTASYVMGSITMVATAIVFIVGLTLRHRFRMKSLRADSSASPELVQRMARMETAIDSVAVEVERISEGQRFTTRLLSDRIPEEVRRG